MEFNKQNVGKFREDFQSAIEELEKKYGCNITLGTITFGSNELRAKMTATKGDKIIKSTKDDFNVGDIVFINHRRISNTESFEILKINNKNIKVRSRDDGRLITVSPSLLKK
jgi:hypothetical protein